ncbi:MAG: radical SAM-associated putative lipoprotein [Alistipes sp.]|nr:radical SAM-associated putative lipoprotein [Alistipes sp.]
MKQFLFFLLGLLGFSACEKAGDGKDNGEQMLMYGTPVSNYTVKGKVTDSAGAPIKGIVVSSTNSYKPFSATTVEDGTFVTNTVSTGSLGGVKLIFADIDGEANGGDFQTTELDVQTLPQSKVSDGDGAWNQGGYEISADVKLEKK